MGLAAFFGFFDFSRVVVEWRYPVFMAPAPSLMAALA
jgi:hypothetical protein